MTCRGRRPQSIGRRRSFQNAPPLGGASDAAAAVVKAPPPIAAAEVRLPLRCRAALFALAALSLHAFPARAGPDERPGERFHVRAAELPKAHATPSVANSAGRVSRPTDARLRVPDGFRSTLFRVGLRGPRWMAVAANGDVVLAESNAGRLSILRDADGDGRAELIETFSNALSQPHGLAIHDGWLYVSDPARVWRLRYRPGQLRAEGEPQPVTPEGALGDGRGHWTRTLAISPDGRHLFVTVGSRSNVAEEAEPRATVQRFALDGSGQVTFAAGLRNAVGLAFRPGTDELWAHVNERDGLGDGLVPDYLAQVRQGDFFGWPYAYLGPNPDPDFGARRPDLVARSKVPEVLFEAHSAPIGMAFYDGAMFPPAWRGGAFVALQGSWNSARPTGYKVVFVPFENGRPPGWYENFATGFWVAGERTAQAIGKPAGLAVARDGALLIADDVGGAVWRVSYGR